MSNWYETLNGTFTKVWDRLSEGADARAQIALGTVSPDGWPEVRTVVMRDANAQTQSLEIYTDLQSDKIASLTANPKAAIQLWDSDLTLQIRLQATVSILSGDETFHRWKAIPDHSKLSYGVTPPPGQVIPDSTVYTKEPNKDVFAVLSCTVTTIDAVYLGKIHRRAAFSRDSEWAGKWLAP